MKSNEVECTIIGEAINRIMSTDFSNYQHHSVREVHVPQEEDDSKLSGFYLLMNLRIILLGLSEINNNNNYNNNMVTSYTFEEVKVLRQMYYNLRQRMQVE